MPVNDLLEGAVVLSETFEGTGGISAYSEADSTPTALTAGLAVFYYDSNAAYDSALGAYDDIKIAGTGYLEGDR